MLPNFSHQDSQQDKLSSNTQLLKLRNQNGKIKYPNQSQYEINYKPVKTQIEYKTINNSTSCSSDMATSSRP